MGQGVGRHLERRFLLAAMLLAAIAIADFLAVEYHTRTASRDAEVTNLAGRQRMLAGRIAFLVGHLDAPDVPAEMNRSIDKMRHEFDTLVEPGGEYLAVAEVRERYFSGERPLARETEEYLIAAASGDATRIGELYLPLAADIDLAVNAYAAHAARRITLLRLVEAAGLAAQLLVIWLIGLGIFRPMAKRMDNDFRAIDAGRVRLRSILDAAAEGICGIDKNGCIIFINAAACRMLGCNVDEVLGANLHTLAHHHEADGRPMPTDACPVLQAARAGSQQRMQLDAFWRSDGSSFPVELVIAPLQTQEGFTGAVVVFSDITERRAGESCRDLSGNILNSIAEGVFVTSPDGVIRTVNPAFSVITGYQPEEAVGQTPRLLKSDRHDSAYYRAMWEAIGNEGYWQGEIWNRRKNGDPFCAWQTVTAIRDGRGTVTHYVSVFSNITEHKVREEDIRHQAYHDHLTDLPNRALFMDRLKLALARARREGRQLAVMFVDLDRFKDINDRLGHDAGDTVLIEASRRLSAVLRDSDTVARLGGDEFIVLLPDVIDAADAAPVAGKMLAAMARPFNPANGHEVQMGASIGIAIFPKDGDDAGSLIKASDEAMYAVKSAGRNGYRFA